MVLRSPDAKPNEEAPGLSANLAFQDIKITLWHANRGAHLAMFRVPLKRPSRSIPEGGEMQWRGVCGSASC
jgi:hypothetical protein